MSEDPLDGAADALLAERAVDGDTRAFEVLIRRHSSIMRAYAARLLGSNSEVDDVVQDTFITAWNQLSRLSDPAAIRSWLMRIVSRKAFDHIRTRRDTVELDTWNAVAPESTDPEHQAEISSELDAVSRTLDALPIVQQRCWILKEVGGYSYQEIAGELDISLATARGSLARARQSLLRGMEVWR